MACEQNRKKGKGRQRVMRQFRFDQSEDQGNDGDAAEKVDVDLTLVLKPD